jgi:hypothetical protein
MHGVITQPWVHSLREEEEEENSEKGVFLAYLAFQSIRTFNLNEIQHYDFFIRILLKVYFDFA